MNLIDGFIYFTDVVKTYEVNHSNDKREDDKFARQSFWDKAEKGKAFLTEELEIINPTKIIALGNRSYDFLSRRLCNNYPIQKIRHPSRGGAKIAREQLKEVLKTTSLILASQK